MTTIYEATAVLSASRHSLPNDVLRSIQSIWMCASAARFGQPYETWWWDEDDKFYRKHDTAECEADDAGTPADDWRDPQAELGGVVAVGSRCACGANDAVTVLNSPRWGAWDVCQPCGNEQLAVLHGDSAASMARPDLIERQAVRCIQFDAMLSI